MARTQFKLANKILALSDVYFASIHSYFAA